MWALGRNPVPRLRAVPEQGQGVDRKEETVADRFTDVFREARGSREREVQSQLEGSGVQGQGLHLFGNEADD